MVRVGSGWSQNFEQASEAPLAIVLETDGEVRPAERRQQVEAGGDELTNRGEVHNAVGREASKQRVDRRVPTSSSAQNTDTPHRGWPSSTYASCVRRACSRSRSTELGPPRTTTTASEGGRSSRRSGRRSSRAGRSLTRPVRCRGTGALAVGLAIALGGVEDPVDAIGDRLVALRRRVLIAERGPRAGVVEPVHQLLGARPRLLPPWCRRRGGGRAAGRPRARARAALASSRAATRPGGPGRRARRRRSVHPVRARPTPRLLRLSERRVPRTRPGRPSPFRPGA